MSRRAVAALLVAAAFACARPPAPPRGGEPSSGGRRPKLVLVVVVDQMRADYLERFGPAFRGGFARLLAEGAVFTEASHAHGVTHTAPGHASLATGRFPSHTGIIANTWYDRARHEEAYSVTDEDGLASPNRLIGDAIGDWMKRSDARARVITASAKDRTAILLGGRRPDAAYWYDGKRGRFRTSTYYAKRLPDWMSTFESRFGALTYFARAWEPSPLPAGVDEARLGIAHPSSGDFASGFPHLVGGLAASPDKAFFGDAGEGPWIDEMVAHLALELLEREQLGERGATDLLALSFSALDYVGHEYGPQSREALDVLLRVDALLGEIFARLDARLGRGSWLVGLSADHGSAPLPEAVGGGFRRVGVPEVLCFQRVEGELAVRHGGRHGWFEWGLYLDGANLRAAGLRRQAVAAEAATLLSSCPGVARVLTASELGAAGVTSPQGEAADPVRAAYARSYVADRSADLFVHWQEQVVPVLGTGTTHQGVWPYDRRVPFLVSGFGVGPGRHSEPVRTVDLAPTLAALAGVAVPSGLDGVDRSAAVVSSER